MSLQTVAGDEHSNNLTELWSIYNKTMSPFLNILVAKFSRSQHCSVQALQHSKHLNGLNNKIPHFLLDIPHVPETLLQHQFVTNSLGTEYHQISQLLDGRI